VAVLLAGGVLLGFAALVIDVGQIYAEREELVTGADAAALAIGRACSNDRPECANESAILSLASSYANANASDGVSNVLEVCGDLPGRLSPCTAGPANLTRCLGTAPPGSTAFVEVRLSTQVGDGLVLPPVFAQTLVGNEGYDGAAVRACARVSWERINVFGLTVSTCEFADAPSPSGPPYGPGDEHVVQFQTDSYGRCGPGIPGRWDSASHAGYLDANGQCLTDVPGDGEMWGDEPPDLGPYEPPCGRAALDALINSGQPVWVPVHDAHRHVGSRTVYRVLSVAKFVVTGYYFGNDPDEQRRSVLTGALPCQSSPGRPHSCISGVFAGPSQPLHTIADDAIVKLIG
jgi:hypothetical protein